MKTLTQKELDDATIWSRGGFRRIDTHIPFKPVAKHQSDVCCNGDCAQAHQCPRYQAANDEPPTLPIGWLIAFVAAAFLAAYAITFGDVTLWHS